MVEYDWSEDKNKELKQKRGITFNEVLEEVQASRILAIIKHPNQKKYPNQKMMFIEKNHYVIAVPFIENHNVRFLKTLYPSRVATKKYLRRKRYES